MAIGTVIIIPGVTQAQYEQVRNQVMPNNQRAAGQLSHLAGPTEDGWCVVETWESKEAAQRFFEQTLRQPLEQAGISAQPTIFQIHNSIMG
jgi:hypothetical protein